MAGRSPTSPRRLAELLSIVLLALTVLVAAAPAASGQSSGTTTGDTSGPEETGPEDTAPEDPGTIAPVVPLGPSGQVQVPALPVKAYALVDADTGAILAADDLHEPLLVASTVKLMTALTAFEKLGLEGTTTISALADARVPMAITAREGQVWPIEELMRSMIMVSANDASYALAEAASGTVEQFAADMADLGRRLGLRDSTLADPAGLDGADSSIGGSRMSAFDLAVVGRAYLQRPELVELSSTVRHQFVDPAGRERNLLNHNRMLPGRTYEYRGALGLKTGYTRAARHTFVAAARRDGRTLIAVIVGGQQLYQPVTALLDAGFAAGPSASPVGQLPPLVRVQSPAERAAAAPAAAEEPAVAVAKDGAAATGPTVAASEGGGVPAWGWGVLAFAGGFAWLWFRPKARRSRARMRARAARERERARRQQALRLVEPDDVGLADRRPVRR